MRGRLIEFNIFNGSLSFLVAINNYSRFSVISNGNGNMCPFSENDPIMFIMSIGDAFHAYISNKVTIIHDLYVDTPVVCRCWIFLNNICSLSHSMALCDSGGDM